MKTHQTCYIVTIWICPVQLSVTKSCNFFGSLASPPHLLWFVYWCNASCIPKQASHQRWRRPAPKSSPTIKMDLKISYWQNTKHDNNPHCKDINLLNLVGKINHLTKTMFLNHPWSRIYHTNTDLNEKDLKHQPSQKIKIKNIIHFTMENIISESVLWKISKPIGPISIGQNSKLTMKI